MTQSVKSKQNKQNSHKQKSKDLNRHFSRKGIQSANDNISIGISITKKIQIIMTVRQQFILTNMTIIKTNKQTNKTKQKTGKHKYE